MDQTTRALREALRNYRTRRATIQQAVTEGEDVVERAIALLNDRDEGVRWAAVRILAEVGDKRAIPPLLRLMDGGRHLHDAAEALRLITGESLGEDPLAWRQWLGLVEAPAAPTKGATPDPDAALTDEELLRMALEDTPVIITSVDASFTVDVPLTEGRRQRVWLDLVQNALDGAPMIQLCTLCGPDNPRHYEWALKTNTALAFGAIGVARIDDQRCFTMTHNLARTGCHPEDLGRAILTLAREGDKVEALFTQKDQN